MVVKQNNIIWSYECLQQTKLKEIKGEGEKETKMVKDFYEYYSISSSLTSKSPDFQRRKNSLY
jgi:hypothetical protein